MNSKVQYSYESAPAKANCGPVLSCKYSPTKEYRKCYYEDVKTLYDCFQRGLSLSRDDPCYGMRPIDKDGHAGDYVWLTYGQIWERVQNFGSGLIYLDLVPKRYNLRCIGVFARNCVEWSILEQACNAYNLTIVPTYETLGADAILHILRETEMKSIVCSSVETVKILSMKEKTVPLEVIIQMEDITDGDRELAANAGVKLYSMSEIEEIGKEHHAPCTPPKPDDICTICYTSGTTGVPKARSPSPRHP
ncbi:hypothetical protein BLSTO_05479 [Blastocystis sp. subtype 1]